MHSFNHTELVQLYSSEINNPHNNGILSRCTLGYQPLHRLVYTIYPRLVQVHDSRIKLNVRNILVSFLIHDTNSDTTLKVTQN